MNDSQDSNKKESPRDVMTFLEHLEELRVRLIRSFIAVIAGMFICWIFRENIRTFLEAPLFEAWKSVPGLPPPEPLSFQNLMEPFIAYLKISVVGGLFLASPYLFYQLWKFVSPGLYAREKRLALPFVIISSFLFMVGSVGAYSYVFPIGFSFFLQFSAGGNVDYFEADVSNSVIYVSPQKIKNKHNAGNHNAGNLPKKKREKKEKREKKGTSAFVHAKKMYRWLENRLLGDSCSLFSAKRNTSQKSKVLLTFSYNTLKCGKPPSKRILFKNGKETTLLLRKNRVEKGRDIFAAWDTVSIKKGAKYKLETINSSSRKLAPVLMVKDYLDFAVKLLLSFGLVFELPILIFFLAYAGIVDYVQLIGFGRWFIVFSVVFAAILTPPDVVTQLLLAAPLIVLYYISILVVYILNKKQSQKR